MIEARRSALVWTPPFSKWGARITRPMTSNDVCTSQGGVSPQPLAGSQRRMTKTQSGIYVNSEKNVLTMLSLQSCGVSCGDSLYVPHDILAICSTSAGAVLSLVAEYCHGSRRHPYMARGLRFPQNPFTALKRAWMLRAGMLVRCFRTSVPKTSYSSWMLLLELLSAQSGSMMTARNTQTRELSPDSPGCLPRNSTLPFPPPTGGRTRNGCSGNHLARSPSTTPSSTPLLRRPRSASPSPPSPPSLPPHVSDSCQCLCSDGI